MSSRPWGVHWFRRDLRLEGNHLLEWNRAQNDGRVLGLFCFDRTFLSRPDFSANRFQFFLETLKVLRKDFRDRGGEILIVDEGPLRFFERLVASHRPSCVTWNRDYEPFARKRDEKVELFLGRHTIPIRTDRDHLHFEPHEILKKDGRPFRVYGAFRQEWLRQFHLAKNQPRLSVKMKTGSFASIEEIKQFTRRDGLAEFLTQNAKKVTVPLPRAGHCEAIQALQKFRRKLSVYGRSRDFPFEEGTSRLSVYLKNGSITTSQVLALLKLHRSRSDSKFLNELIWREFYYSILFHFPSVETDAFNPIFHTLEWDNKKEQFQKWCKGQTGFPIVDAGMRELEQTGWMHNRVRMIVASFLVKDLLIDWRWGEQFFMNHLLDGDLAANNGGWQWCASTGCDPQPYFRIFNPWLQGKRFDPDGAYIRRYFPELKNVLSDELHHPEGERPRYPRPIVEHSLQRQRALELYTRARKLNKKVGLEP